MSKNFFRNIESKISYAPERILFNEKKIRELAEKLIFDEINKRAVKARPAFFERIVCDFFRFRYFKLFKTKKTRDMGLDALIKTRLEPFGQLDLGLQIKYKKIDSTDVDLFLQALNFAEIRLGVLVCKDATRLDKYTLSAKLRAILLGSDENVKIEKRIALKPVFILKFSDILDIFARTLRLGIKAIYKE